MPEYTMPISGVINETFDRDGGSIRGDDDFFSVARTTPFVAKKGKTSLTNPSGQKHIDICGIDVTFDTKRSDALVHGIQSVLCNALVLSKPRYSQAEQAYQSERASRCGICQFKAQARRE
jgi:hypothetical protein